MELHLIHIPKAGTANMSLTTHIGGVAFETCLRKIIFFNSPVDKENSDFKKLKHAVDLVETFHFEQAYRFTLEVICGLHSLIKGETEIFGQFKEFVVRNKSQIEAQGLMSIFQQILTDCKALRNSRIQNWGHNTYGSVTRKLLRVNDGVVLVGSGQLAQEIAPWLKHVSNKKVILRRPRDLEPSFSQFQVEMVHDLTFALDATVLVVAANITNVELEKHLRCWPNIRMVIDWRGDERWIQKKCEDVFHLHDLKRNDEKSKIEQDQRVRDVSADIQIKALEFIKKAKHNPWGWEDFCA
ncbi:MAG: hypothetical protein JNL11_01020 [Bdellovibrionaceae bacterium]|nr:hypothetical protein [Pseudobdellovibrionaceae bacterium]